MFRIEDSRSAQCLRASWKQGQVEEERGLESEGRESGVLVTSSGDVRKEGSGKG